MLKRILSLFLALLLGLSLAAPAAIISYAVPYYILTGFAISCDGSAPAISAFASVSAFNRIHSFCKQVFDAVL